ncbi:MAG: glycine zipper family protein, partial [Candidatus Nanoarchaeia archaeon]
SWCVYEGKIDEGDDLPGSRHYKYVCSQGEIIIEPCADYRNEICMQENTFNVKLNQSEEAVEFSNANCIANNWRECIDLNSQEEGMEECNSTLNCFVQEVNIDSSFKFDVCVPRYPGGFHLANENEQKMAEEICGMASQTCTVIYKEDWDGDCECVENCDCESAEFTEKMNDFCRKLGDCGLEVNVEGKYTENYAVKNAPKLGDKYINKLREMANPDNYPNQYAEVELALQEYLEATGLWGGPGEQEGEGGGGGDMARNIGLGAAGIGAAIGYGSYHLGGLIRGAGLDAGIGLQQFSLSIMPYANAAIGAGIGMVAGSMIADAIGLSQAGSMLMAAGVGMLGLSATAAITEVSALSFALSTPFIVIAIVLIIASLFFMAGDCEPVEVTYTCKPWQPPTGGEDCEACNDMPGCSEYKCKSLGAACELINKGAEQELCIEANPDDATPPNIAPGNIEASGDNVDFKETDSGIELSQEGCLDAYMPVTLRFNTDEPAQCKFDLEEKEYEEMQFYLGGSGYLYNHTEQYILPDPSHGQSHGINWSGDVRFYIKCQDTHGNLMQDFYTIDMCVNQGPDENPPSIIDISPSNDAMISYNKTEQFVEIRTNEIATCRWSYNDVEYGEMENEMDCWTDFSDYQAHGYGYCNTTLPASHNENAYYIKCKDQPWLEEGNANRESFTYVLNKPDKPISLEWIEPAGEIGSEAEVKTLILKAKTQNGGQEHICRYSFSGYNNMITFYNTFERLHEQEFQLGIGNHKVYVECEDETGDMARGETDFRIIKQTAGAEIARIYQQDGSLKIVTTQDAECVYALD